MLIPAVLSSAANVWLNSLLLAPGDYSLTAHLLMLGGHADMTLDPVMWTLVHEIRVSVIFPVIFLSIRKIGAVPTVAACLAISLLASFGLTDSIPGDWQATFHFLWMFAAGSALSYRRADIVRLMKTCNRGATTGLWSLSILLLIVPFNRVWGDFLIGGGGAALLICLCLDRGRITAALVVPPALWLGRVSYSLYLIHLPILIFATTSGIGGIGRLPVFVVTLVLAELTYRLLEQPSHWIGVKLSNLPGPPQPPI